MLSESWLKDKHPCLVFVKVHIRDKGRLRSRLMMFQDQESDDSDHQDIQVEDSPKESEHESEHSYHDQSHMMSTLSPQNFGYLSAPEVSESLKQ